MGREPGVIVEGKRRKKTKPRPGPQGPLTFPSDEKKRERIAKGSDY